MKEGDYMPNTLNLSKPGRILCTVFMILLVVGLMTVPCLADGNGDVAGAVEATWNSAKGQVKTITNNVIFPVIDMILAILFFVKIGTAYFDYRKH